MDRLRRICSKTQTRNDENTQIAKFMGPPWGPPGSSRPQIGPMLAPWTLLPGHIIWQFDKSRIISPLFIHNGLWFIRWKLRFSSYKNIFHFCPMNQKRKYRQFDWISIPGTGSCHFENFVKWSHSCLFQYSNITDFTNFVSCIFHCSQFSFRWSCCKILKGTAVEINAVWHPYNAVNSLKPRDADTRESTGFLGSMACCLCNTKPSPEPILTCQLSHSN